MGKKIVDIAIEVMKKNDWPSVMWGDCGILDTIARECKHTNLMDLHPLNRHQRILNALQKSDKFKTMFVTLNGKRGNQTVRVCNLMSIKGDSDN